MVDGLIVSLLIPRDASVRELCLILLNEYGPMTYLFRCCRVHFIRFPPSKNPSKISVFQDCSYWHMQLPSPIEIVYSEQGLSVLPLDHQQICSWATS